MVVLLLYMSVIEIYTRGVLARSVADGWWLIWAHQESLHPVNLPLVYSASFSSLSFVSAVHAQQKRSFPAFSRSVRSFFPPSAEPLFSSLSLWLGLLSDSWNIGCSNTAGGVLSLLPRPFLFFYQFFSVLFSFTTNRINWLHLLYTY